MSGLNHSVLFLSVSSSEFSVNIYNAIYKNKELSAEDTRVKYNIDYMTIFSNMLTKIPGTMYYSFRSLFLSLLTKISKSRSKILF